MSVEAPVRQYSDAEWHAFANAPGVEFIDGEPQEKPMGTEERGVAFRISGLLYAAIKGKGFGQAFVEAAYRIPGIESRRFRKPDVSFIRSVRVPADLKDIDVFDIAPDLAIEVVSPNDTVYEVEKKVKEYLAAGVELIWIINPAEQTVTIRRADRSIALLEANDELDGEAVIPGFRCKVSAIFDRA